MQIPKEQIRNKILDAAAEEFYQYKYTKASLRNIAKNANITTSNIYCYYRNKESLYAAVVAPAWESIQSLMRMDKRIEKTSQSSTLQISEEIAKVYFEHRCLFEILIQEDADAPGENTKTTLITLVKSHIYHDIQKIDTRKEVDYLLVDALIIGVCEAILYILSQYDGDRELLKRRLYQTVKVVENNLAELGK